MRTRSHKGANALVIAATGKIWSNGLDLNWLGQHQDRLEEYLCTWMRLMGRFLVFPVPTVGAIGVRNVVLAINHTKHESP